MTYQTDILLVTATEIESQAVLNVFASGTPPAPHEIDGLVYFDLGRLHQAGLFLLQSPKMGSSGLGAAQQSVAKGIQALHPSAVIMVGIAFGMNETKQQLGEVLVSEWLRPYDLQRVGKKIILRDSKPDASSTLLSRCKNAKLLWQGAKVHFGVILSGDKLVDNLDYRQQLQKFEPEAIGGEMEGRGLYTACQEARVDWILVKAICDWADGNKNNPDKDKHQQTAAENAARFVRHALEFTPYHGKATAEEESPSPAPVFPVRALEIAVNRQQQEAFESALIKAFPTKAALERMLMHQMGENLEAVAGGGALRDIAFQLIQWASSCGRLVELIRGARSENPGNSELQVFCRQIGIE